MPRKVEKKAGRDAWAALNREWQREQELGEAARGGGSKALRAFWDSRGCIRCVRELMVRYDVLTLEDYEKALKRWRDPATRRADRFYCRRHTEKGEAGAARYRQPPLTLTGHVAWSFRMDSWTAKFYERHGSPGPFQVGSFGAGKASPVTSTTNYESDLTANPVTYFANMEYDSYKFLEVGDANFEGAVIAALEIAERPYGIVLSNCLDATHHVLGAYGVRDALPPQAMIAPNVWYDNLPGATVALQD